MLNFKPEQFTATQKANLDAFTGFTTQAFTGFEKLVELNLAAAKALLGDSFAHTQALLVAKDAKEFMGLHAALAQPLTEKSVAYSRHVQSITTDASAEFTKAFEAKFAEAQAVFSKVVENVAKNAPAGTESAVAVFQNALTTGQQAIESAQSSAKKAMEMAETNFAAAAEQAVKAASSVAQKA